MLHPDEACQRAIEQRLIVHRIDPLICETSLATFIDNGVPTNTDSYVRNHFHIPLLDSETWRLNVGGLVDRPQALTLRDLYNMSAQTRTITLECAGNGRARFSPPTTGVPWGLGAVSNAEWTGVPLIEVLDRTGVRPGAQEVIFRGADSGQVSGQPGTIHYERSLQLDDAKAPDVLLAYAINGEPLPVQYGYPLRLIVPGWYGMAAVKWLSRISAVAEPFRGRFQAEKYVIEGRPVRHIEVRAVIAQPAPGSIVRPGADVMLRGYAWSGRAPVEAVEVDAGEGWQRARLLDGEHRFAWRRWELPWRAPDTPGEVTVRCRARDAGGATQPEEVAWNALGYANNSIRPHPVRVLPLPSGPGRRPA